MNNELCLGFWKSKAENNPTIKTSKVSDINDFSEIDKDFILKYVNKETKILDLAAGTGITLNKYYDKVSEVTAVEKYKQFSDFIVKAPNITVINEDISVFEPQNQYDVILMFGIVSYFNRDEIEKIYQKYLKYLKPNGKLIIKNQFGINEDVIVANYSEELGCDYFSEFRQIQSEINMLKTLGLNKNELIDIYPPECNRWGNTHFYAIVSSFS